MSELPANRVGYDVVCPHCKKTFHAELISGSAARYEGFKCPHCRLFVPYARADERHLVDRVD